MRGHFRFFLGTGQSLPEDALTAWGILMKTFPGSFPSDVFDRLSLERFAEAYALAIEFIEAEAQAIKDAQGR